MLHTSHKSYYTLLEGWGPFSFQKQNTELKTCQIGDLSHKMMWGLYRRKSNTTKTSLKYQNPKHNTILYATCRILYTAII